MRAILMVLLAFKGLIDPAEFVQWSAKLGDADKVDWPRIVGFAEFDSDGNGSLELQEFVHFLTTTSNRRYVLSLPPPPKQMGENDKLVTASFLH